MIHTARTVRTLQAVAIGVSLAVFLWSTGLPTFFRIAEAASIQNASDTLSTSQPSTASNHTIAFTTPSGMLASSTITITFPSGFTNVASLDYEDIDVMASGTDKTVAAAPSTSGVWGASFAGQVLTLVSPTDVSQSSSTPFIIEIGTHATFGTTSNTQIINPSATTSHLITIGGTMPDSGQVRVAILDQVTVSASVDASLTFTVSGVNSSSTVNGSATTTIATSTPTTLPFGTLPIGVSRTLAHDLAVSTNADNGYTVTVEQEGDLQSTTGGTIDGFFDGTDTVTPTAWVGPSGQISDLDTYGHWGLTSSDGTTTRSLEFSSDTWVSGSTTPIVIMGHDGPADGLTAGIGAARIGYQVQITALQEAGSDYSTRIRYIATPTF